jgi:predicted permease
MRELIRSWRRRPAYAVGVAATLALGIGLNAAVFAAVDAVLLRPLPYPQPDRLLAVWTALPLQDRLREGASPPELLDLEAASRSFDDLGGIWARSGVLRGDGQESEQIENGWVSGGFLRTLGVEPFIGRWLEPRDTLESSSPAIVIGYELWMRRYGGDRELLGRAIEFDDESWRVVGVMPRGFRLWLPAEQGVPTILDAWTPWRGDYRDYSRRFRVFGVVARLKAGRSLADAQGDLDRVAAAVAGESADYETTGYRLGASPLQEALVAPARRLLAVLACVALFLLLVACANVVGLVLARATERQRDFAVRAALGAARWRLTRQVLVESAALALIGGALGLLAGDWVLRLLLSIDTSLLPRGSQVEVGWRSALFALAVSLAVGCGLGIAGGLFASRPRAQALRAGTRVSGHPGEARLRSLLVAAQMALSFALLFGAGLMARSFVSLSRVDPGFSPEGVLTLRMSLPDVHYRYEDQYEKIARFYAQLEERLQALPGVEAAGATINPPLSGVSSGAGPYAYVGPDGEREWETLVADYRTVTPGWFRAVGARLRGGRFLRPSDHLASPEVVVVDRQLAAKAWPGQIPVGRRLKVEVFRESRLRPVWAEVVGVIDHVQLDRIGFAGREQVYLPHSQSPMRSMTLTLRSALPEAALVPAVQTEVGRLEPGLPVFGIARATTHVAHATAATRFALVGISLFAAIALLLAGAGVYAVLAGWVSQRRREMGVRLALGAAPRELVALVTAQGVRLAVWGCAAGVAATLLVSRVMAGLLYGVEPDDPSTLAAVAMGLLGVALAASWIPARRAAAVDPAEILSAE